MQQSQKLCIPVAVGKCFDLLIGMFCHGLSSVLPRKFGGQDLALRLSVLSLADVFTHGLKFIYIDYRHLHSSRCINRNTTFNPPKQYNSKMADALLQTPISMYEKKASTWRTSALKSLVGRKLPCLQSSPTAVQHLPSNERRAFV
jgi:hypothetical protein